MTTPRMLYRDQFLNASLAANSEAVDFPKENLQNELRTKTTRTTGVASENYVFDLTTVGVNIVNSIAIVGGNLFSEMFDITIQGNATDSWGSPSVDEIVTRGTNLVDNGSFNIDTTGWSATNCTLAPIGGGRYSTNSLRLTRASGSTQWAEQVLSGFKIGRQYLFSVFTKSGTSGDEAFSFRVENGDSPRALIGAVDGVTIVTGWVRHKVIVTAQSTSIRIRLRKNTATAGTMLFDDCECYEVPESDMLIHYLAADYQFRFWRVLLVESTGSYIELGRVMGGLYFQPAKSFDVNYQRALNDLSTSSMSIGGQGYHDVKDQFTTLQLDFSNMTTTDRDSMLTMYTQARSDRNIALNVDTTAADKPDLSYYGKFTKAFNFTNTLKTSGDERHSMSIEFKESI